MRSCPWLIGFTTVACVGRFLAPSPDRYRSAVPSKLFESRIQLSSRPVALWSSFASLASPTRLPKKTGGRTCLDFSPSSRHHALASTFLRGFPIPRIRCVLRFSQPLDAFLRTRARGLISSRCHVQGRPVQGLLLLRSHPSSSERACPLAVVPGALTAEAVSARRALDFEAFIHARVRCSAPRLFIGARARFPRQVFLLRASISSPYIRLTRMLRS